MPSLPRLAALFIAAAAAGGALAQSAANPPPKGPAPAASSAPAPGGDAAAPPAARAQTGTRSGAKKKSDKAPYKGPSETDIRVAYTERIDAINAGTAQYLDPATAAKLHIRLAKVEIVECAAVEERQDLYLCSVLIESGVGDSVPEFKRAEIAMVKDKDAWRVQ